AERATDLLAVSRLLKKALIGGELDNLEELIKKHSTPAVLVVEELDAPLAASLPPEIEGVVTRSGGTTGHGAIVAASRGIPVYAG
ncbi:PEP-utilizing enzyme, partial [Faecalibacterium prausnitzii]